MKFRRIIILENGVPTKPIGAAARLMSIILANAITVSPQVAPLGPEAPMIPQLHGRIKPLLGPLADQARLSGDLIFAVRAQAQAATLLWPYDRERARAIYRRAFQPLLVGHEPKCDDGAWPEAASAQRPSCFALTAVARQQVLHEIAGRDPGLAEELALAFRASVTGARAGCTSAAMSGGCEGGGSPAFDPSATVGDTKNDVEWRDLLASVAFQIVERDPVRSTRLAESSLAGGVSPHFSRLLLSLREADAGCADLLFAYALGCLERSSDVDLEGLHTLGAFLVSAADPIARKPVESGVVVRFLNCALEELARRGQMAAGRRGDAPASQGIDAEDEAAIYFIGRQLGDLFARYLPDRLGQFKREIAELTAANANEPAVAPTQVFASNPNEIEREARAAATAADRDLLYARAAFAWLARAEEGRAQAAALKVATTAIRDRLMANVARRYNSARRLDDAVVVAHRIEDPTARATILTSLAGAALASGDGVRANAVLGEAASCVLAARPSMDRALALSGIAGRFTAFDARRGFEVMQTAVEAINKVMAQSEASESRCSNPDARVEYELGDLNDSSFEATFAALGRVDFERALSLAQQLAARDISVLGQLAVCRGGLARPVDR